MWPSPTWRLRSGTGWLFVHFYTSTDRTWCKCLEKLFNKKKNGVLELECICLVVVCFFLSLCLDLKCFIMVFYIQLSLDFCCCKCHMIETRTCMLHNFNRFNSPQGFSTNIYIHSLFIVFLFCQRLWITQKGGCVWEQQTGKTSSCTFYESENTQAANWIWHKTSIY